MYSKTIRAGLLVVLMLFGCVASSAQETPQITPEKRALIKELFEVTSVTKTMDAMLDAMGKQEESNIPKSIAQNVSQRGNLTPKEQAALEEKLKQSAARANQRMKEVFKRLNYDQLVLDVMAPIYGKYFTESDLQELVAFYKTPVGKKSVELMPVVITEGINKLSENLLPKIQTEINKIIDDEAKQVERESKPEPVKQPPPRTNKGRRP